MKRTLHRRLASIVSADISGYGLMMAADEERAHRQTGRLVKTLADRVTEYGGSIITVAGDGILSEFPDPVNAVRYGLHVLNHSSSKRRRTQPIAFRIGVHSGDVLIHDGKVGGDIVNIAVRIEQEADPQSILVSGAVYEQVHRTMPVKFEHVGSPPLKHVSKPIELYRVMNEGKRAAQPPPTVTSVAAGPRIAVLPFDNLNPEREDGFFVDGITDDIITALSRFRGLSVIGRESSFKLRTERLTNREFARRLRVRYVLTGSIRRFQQRIRLTVQLIDMRTGDASWADQYDAVLDDLLAIEAGLVQVIVARLAGRLEEAERIRLRSAETRDFEAYGYQLHAQELLWSPTQERILLARTQFEKALSHDPNYARAYTGLSRTHNLDWRYSWVPDRDAALERGASLARLAIAKDPFDARAHAELGYSYLYQKQLAASLSEYRIALDLNPNDADVMAEYADALVYSGQAEEALQWMQRAIQLNPICPDWYYWHLADVYSALCNYERVIETVLRMNDPGQCARLMAASCAHLDRLDEARLHAAEVMNRQPEFRISTWASVLPYGNSPKRDRFIAGLRKAGLPD